MEKAYLVADKYGYEYGGLFFGETPGKAKLEYLYEQGYDNDFSFTDLYAYREPWADKYGDRDKIPITEWLDHNFFVYCKFCDKSIDQDCLDAVVIDDKYAICADCIVEHPELQGRAQTIREIFEEE